MAVGVSTPSRAKKRFSLAGSAATKWRRSRFVSRSSTPNANTRRSIWLEVVSYRAVYVALCDSSFIIKHDVVVYEKDLGKNTAAIASKMTTFNPDASWKRP